jgi:hypothetical protein
MKVKIITLHHIANNFGSVLQGCALCSFLNQNGYDAALIDYIPSPNVLKRIKTAVVNMIFFPYYIKRRRRFRRYLLTHARLTKRYTRYKQLLKDVPQADAYIAGSDQIWNPHFPCGKDDAYYLKFIPGRNKMAYAASTGRLLDDQELAALHRNTQDFRYISLREGASWAQFRRSGREAEHVLDPVFLLDRQYYLKGMGPNEMGRYLLVYAVDIDGMMGRAVKEIAEEKGLKVISIGGFRKKCACDIFIRSAGPEDFVRLVYGAQCILTSSFHAAALSLILNKEFAVVPPRINALRIEDLLETVGIPGRIIRSAVDVQRMKAPIDYEKVNRIIQHMREASSRYLLDCLMRFNKGGAPR